MNGHAKKCYGENRYSSDSSYALGNEIFNSHIYNSLLFNNQGPLLMGPEIFDCFLYKLVTMKGTFPLITFRKSP